MALFTTFGMQKIDYHICMWVFKNNVIFKQVVSKGWCKESSRLAVLSNSFETTLFQLTSEWRSIKLIITLHSSFFRNLLFLLLMSCCTLSYFAVFLSFTFILERFSTNFCLLYRSFLRCLCFPWAIPNLLGALPLCLPIVVNLHKQGPLV